MARKSCAAVFDDAHRRDSEEEIQNSRVEELQAVFRIERAILPLTKLSICDDHIDSATHHKKRPGPAEAPFVAQPCDFASCRVHNEAFQVPRCS